MCVTQKQEKSSKLRNKMYTINSTQVFEIEITNYCNAFCGACDRNVKGGELHTSINLKHMETKTWNNWICSNLWRATP